MAEQKQDECKVLILGGVGFIGRNLVKYIVDNKLATKIRVADKLRVVTSLMMTLGQRFWHFLHHISCTSASCIVPLSFPHQPPPNSHSHYNFQ